MFLSSATRPYGFERAEVELKLAAGKIYRSGARPQAVDWSVLRTYPKRGDGCRRLTQTASLIRIAAPLVTIAHTPEAVPETASVSACLGRGHICFRVADDTVGGIT